MSEYRDMDRALASRRRQHMVVRRLLRFLCGTAVFVAFGYVGRATVIDESSLSLIWPAAGVAALWLSSGNRQTWPGDITALAIATFTVNLTTGAEVGGAVAFVVSNVLQVCVFVFLTRRWFDDVWGLGGVFPFHRLADLGRLVVASAIAALVGTATGALGLALTVGGPEASNVIVWWGRNSVSLLVITTLGLLAGPPLFAATSARDLGRIVYEAVYARTLSRLVEAELLIAASIGLCALIFGQRTAEPLSFLVLVVSVWAGLRFSPIAVMAHALAMGTAGVAFTLNGEGPFADIDSPHFRALVAQVFVTATVLTGLALAFSRAERDRANRRLAQARRESDERARLLGAVLESMHEGLVVIADGGEILVTNTASRELLGRNELSGRVGAAAEYGLFNGDGTPLTDDELPALRALAGEDVPATDYHLRVDAVPEGRVLEISARPLTGQDPGDRPLAMVNIRDVTLDRQHRDALASFAGVVAHDLFNPLTIVSGWAESLEEQFAQGAVRPEAGLPMVARVHEAASHMRHVVGDLLAYTVARDQSLRPVAVDLTTELRSLALLRIDGPTAPLVTVAPGLQAWADAGLVRQLFDNLLGNAVKYVAPGVRPRVDVRGHQDGDWLEIRVTDNGIGIAEDQRELVFETFHRAHNVGYEGTGLGLAICRRIADRHGGSIHAEPGPGGSGTAFVVRLPSTSAGYAAEPALSPRETVAHVHPILRQPA
jgi:signal transduction histidine kinase